MLHFRCVQASWGTSMLETLPCIAFARQVVACHNLFIRFSFVPVVLLVFPTSKVPCFLLTWLTSSELWISHLLLPARSLLPFTSGVVFFTRYFPTSVYCFWPLSRYFPALLTFHTSTFCGRTLKLRIRDARCSPQWLIFKKGLVLRRTFCAICPSVSENNHCLGDKKF